MWLLTAAELEDDQRRAVAALVEAGCRTGDRLGVVAPATPAVVALIVGALRIGVVPVVVNTTLLPPERGAILDDADCRLVLDGDGVAPFVASGGASGAVELAPVPLARPMHYTSGTTGRPKGVWSGVLPDADAGRLWGEEIDQWGLQPGDRYLAAAPLYHSAPLRFAIATLLAGGDVVLLPGFRAAAVAEAIRGYQPTVGFMAPAHLRRLLELDELPPLTSFRLLAHAGEPCPPPLKRRAHALFPPSSIWEFYGSTEGQLTACSAAEWESRPGTVGRARANRRIAVDPDGTIWCSVPPYARFEYWRDAERTARAWRGEAFSVLDLGRLDSDGYLFLEGRREDLIISGGVNVYPAEVEAALAEAPGVREAVVFGLPDDRWGQRVCAALTGTAEPAEVAQWARGCLAPHQRPKAIYGVGETDLLRTATGKLRRLDLADRLAARATPDWEAPS